MAFARIPEQFSHTSPYREAGPGGRGFFIDTLNWCNEHRTDGYVPDADLKHVAPGERYPRKRAEQLWALGLLERLKGFGWKIPWQVYRIFCLPAKDLAYADRRRPLAGTPQAPHPLTGESASSRNHANRVTTPDSERPPAEQRHLPISGEVVQSGEDAPKAIDEYERRLALESVKDLVANVQQMLEQGHQRLAKARGYREGPAPAERKEETA